MTDEIFGMKLKQIEGMKGDEVVMILKRRDGFHVVQWLPDGLPPSSSYITAEEAAARACQLLGLRSPVTPQSWPETAQIGGDGRATPPLNA